MIGVLAEAGIDVIEIGIPFSDPLADGPTIQAASQRALDGGMTVPKALEVTRQVRQQNPDLPIVLMTYYNPLLRYGLERYAADAKAAGADAHIVTDLTPEEAAPWIALSRQHDLDTVFLLAPTSTQERIQAVAKLTTGFVYCVSRTGVTGARQDVPAELTEVVASIKAQTALPVCVGFGVSRPEHIARIGAFADGVVVASAVIDLIQRQRDAPNVREQVRDYVATLKAATKTFQT